MDDNTTPQTPLPDALLRAAVHAVEALARRATVPFVVEKDDQAESVGTGTLFEIEGDHFIVTAEHVGRDIARYELGVPCGPDRREIWFLGDGVVTKSEKYDVAVYRIDNPQSVATLKQAWEFLTLDNIELSAPTVDTNFLLHGYPTDLSPKTDDVIAAAPVAAVTTSYTGPTTNFPIAARPYDPRIDLLLNHPMRTVDLKTGAGVDAPDLRGISGCSVWTVALPHQCDANQVWSPRAAAKIVAVEASVRAGHWIRCTRWWAVADALNAMRKHTT